MLPPSSHKSLFQSSWRTPKWSSHGLHQELAQKLSRKRLQMFSALHMFHIPTLATWTPLHFAHSFPEYQDQHSSLQWETHSRIFFSSWQSCLFPAVVKSDFFLWLPLCSWHLFSTRQKNNFFFSSQLPYGENLVGFAAALPPRKGFKGWQDRLYTYYPNKGSKGWKWYCKQDYTQRWG